MSTGYDTLQSVEDLIGRLNVAAERKVSQSADPDRLYFSLGLPLPIKTTNAQLREFEPFYIDLLENIENNNNNVDDDENNNILDRLDSSDDEAILILYAFQFPLLVLMARKDVSGNAKCYINEEYTIPDIAERIVSNKRLLDWCRKCITEHYKHILTVVGGAACILSSVNPLQNVMTKSKAKKRIRKNLFCDDGDVPGFADLRKDLAKVVSRKDINSTVVVHCIMVQLHVLSTLYGKDDAVRVLSDAEHKSSFDNALHRVRRDLNPDLFRFLRITILGTSTPQEEIFHLVSTTCEKRREPCADPRFVCGREGCDELAKFRCARCQLVGYCGRKCQVADWKNHKAKGCKPILQKKTLGTTNAQKVVAATEAARRAPDPALLQQDRRLCENPNFDYIIHVSKNKDVGVRISDEEMPQTFFRLFRLMAPNKPGAVNCMYDLLKNVVPQYSNVIRKQLMAEYGVDPLSDIAKNGELPKVNVEELIESIQGTHYKVNLDTGMATLTKYLE